MFVYGIKPGPKVFFEILARGGVSARLDAAGVIGPGRSITVMLGFFLLHYFIDNLPGTLIRTGCVHFRIRSLQ